MTTGGDAMSELKWVPWTQWSRGGMVGAGQMTLKQVQENLQRFERKAREILSDTGADHVLYGVKYYGDDGTLEKVGFYLEAMDDERFHRDVSSISNATVYAVHKMK